MRSMFALMVCALLWAFPAHADAPATEDAPADERTTMEWMNDAFASVFVSPLATVMFFDLAFWDNTVSGDAAVGLETTVDSDPPLRQVVVGHRAEGLEKRNIYELRTPDIVFETPTEMTLGKLRVFVHTANLTSRQGTSEPVLMAEVPAQDVDLASIGLTPLPEEPTEGEPVQVVTQELAPFAIRVDRQTRQVVASNIRIDQGHIKMAEGLTVRATDGELATVTQVVQNREVVAHGNEIRIGPEHRLPNPNDVQIPFIVAWLVMGAVFFTVRMAFVNVRMFGHAIAVTTGRYDSPHAEGEISHFQALSSALSATVGLGNIAGVAIAVSVGGPGAVFWMVIAGILGMSSKFVECTLGQMYRTTRPDGSVSGGPMHYLDTGLAELGMGTLGKILAVMFAIMCIGGSLGGGNMFQANQSQAAVAQTLLDWGVLSPGYESTVAIVYGVLLSVAVAAVIIGGIKRIGLAASVVVPFMCGLYVLAGIFIIVTNAGEIPAAATAIVREAFTPAAGVGGFLGVLIQGFRRAAFSNEAGVGSASIAHSAASTEYPVREGVVALLEPFIDTVVVCTMTGLVVVVTGAYLEGGDGVVMTQTAFGSAVSWFPVLLSIAVMLFAFSTMLSWSYYGERCAIWLFGDSAQLPYRILFVFCVFLGANFSLGSVLDFSDLMVLGMAFPNILGALFLSSKVKAALDEYTGKLNAGEFKPRSA